MKKIVIIGASGFIGSTMFNYLSQKLSNDYVVKGTYFSNKRSNELQYMDITDSKQIEHYLLMEKPDFILMLAGSKDVKKCEMDYSFAYKMNTQPVEFIIDTIKKHELDTEVIFFSTDYVFDGEKGNYTTKDIPNPITNYGKTKLLAERVLFESNIDFKIIRTGAVMGKNGIFFDWLIRALTTENDVPIFENMFFSPTPIQLLNEMVCELILNYEKIPEKLIHIVGDQRLNRYQFAMMISRLVETKCANLVPENANLEQSLFHKDLSLNQSDFVRERQTKSLDEYLENEVYHD